MAYKFLSWVALLGGILFFIGCDQNSGSVDEIDRIVVRVKDNPMGLNPTINLGATESSFYNLLFLSLAEYDAATLKFEPFLAKSLPIAEDIVDGEFAGGVSYTMEIRDDAKWDDGLPITAEDYVFTIKAIKHPGTNSIRYRAYTTNLVDVEISKENPKKFTVFFGKKNIASMELAASIPILPKHIYDPTSILDKISISELIDEARYAIAIGDQPEVDSFPIRYNSVEFLRENVQGAGRYRLKEWVTDQYIALERKENHWAAKSNKAHLQAKPKEVVIAIVPDEAASFTMFKSGEIDILSSMSIQQVEDLKNSETYSNAFDFHQVSIPRYYYMSLNTRNPVLEEESVRQALALLMDVDTIIDSYEKGLGERVNSPFLSVDEFSKLEDVQYDLDEAKSILSEAGWEDTNGNGILDKVKEGKLVELEYDFLGTGSALGQFISGVFKQMAEPAGIKVNIVNVDQINYKKKLNNLDFDIALGAKSQSFAPYDPYALLHTDNSDPGESNIMNFGNAESDSLIMLIRTTNDERVRDDAYLKLEALLYDSKPMIFLYSPMEQIAHKKELKGVISRKKPGFAVNTFTAN